MDEPSGTRAILALRKRDFPDRLSASSWCGRHPKERTVPVLRAQWVCLDCARERQPE